MKKILTSRKIIPFSFFFMALISILVQSSDSSAQTPSSLGHLMTQETNTPVWIKRKMTSQIKIRDVYTNYTSAFFLADIVTQAGPSGSVLLWMPETSTPKVFVLDGKEDLFLNQFLNQYPTPQLSSLAYLSTKEKKARSDWHDYYQVYNTSNSYSPLQWPFEERALFNPDQNLSLYELAIKLDFKTGLFKFPQFPNSLFLHSFEGTGVSSTRLSFTSDPLNPNYQSTIKKINHFLRQDTLELFSSPREHERYPHIQFFNSISAAGSKEQLVLITSHINEHGSGVALRYDPFTPQDFTPMSLRGASILSFNRMSNDYQMDNRTLKNFDPSLTTEKPILTNLVGLPQQNTNIPGSISFYLSTTQNGFSFNNQFYKPSLDSELQFNEFNRWFLTLESRSIPFDHPHSIFNPLKKFLDEREKSLLRDKDIKSKSHPAYYFTFLNALNQPEPRLIAKILGSSQSLSCQSILSIP